MAMPWGCLFDCSMKGFFGEAARVLMKQRYLLFRPCVSFYGMGLLLEEELGRRCCTSLQFRGHPATCCMKGLPAVRLTNMLRDMTGVLHGEPEQTSLLACV